MEIHLLNPLWEAYGGSEWRTVSLYRELCDRADVQIWTEYEPHPSFASAFPIREMLKLQDFPKTGTFVFVGCYWEIGRWVAFAKPDRVILVYNVEDPEGLEYRISQLASYGVENVELVFPSATFARYANGRPGTVEYSPIDFDRFSPGPYEPRTVPVVGRHSRDETFKHHPDDPALYHRLKQAGFEVQVMGGLKLAEMDREGTSANLHPAGYAPADEFLHGLDIFFYRTDPSWTEPYGRVVAEAMACGLPCVLEDRGGYTSLIQQGENGFLFRTEQEAVGQLEALKDSALRRRVGKAARARILELYASQRRAMLDFYLAKR